MTMLEDHHIDLRVAQPSLNHWLVQCHIFPCADSAHAACHALEVLTDCAEHELDAVPETGKLVSRGLAEITPDGAHVVITATGINFYGALQAWLKVYQQNHPPEA